jgi:hypothetical protein
MVQTQIDQLTKVQKDLLVNASREKQACEIHTRGGATTQDPLYPEGHPKRIEQDSQRTSSDDIPSKKKKKKHKIVAEFSKTGKDPNSVSISDAETESGNASDKEKSLPRMQSTLRKTSLPTSMVMRENLGCKNQTLFPVRNTNPRKKNTTTGFVNGWDLYFCIFL